MKDPKGDAHICPEQQHTLIIQLSESAEKKKKKAIQLSLEKRASVLAVYTDCSLEIVQIVEVSKMWKLEQNHEKGKDGYQSYHCHLWIIHCAPAHVHEAQFLTHCETAIQMAPGHLCWEVPWTRILQQCHRKKPCLDHLLCQQREKGPLSASCSSRVATMEASTISISHGLWHCSPFLDTFSSRKTPAKSHRNNRGLQIARGVQENHAYIWSLRPLHPAWTSPIPSTVTSPSTGGTEE